MAVDKKSDHVGNHGGAYTDNDGMSKQFTYVDHDIKTSVSTNKPLTEDEKKDIRNNLKVARANLLKAILDIPAVFCHEVHQDFTLRGESVTSIQWNKEMLSDEGLPMEKLNDIRTLADNKKSLLKKGIEI
jgi:hypothetical protein